MIVQPFTVQIISSGATTKTKRDHLSTVIVTTRRQKILRKMSMKKVNKKPKQPFKRKSYIPKLRISK
jgi:hypothetical protein